MDLSLRSMKSIALIVGALIAVMSVGAFGASRLELTVNDFTFTPTDTTIELSVFMSNNEDYVASFEISFAIRNPSVLRFLQPNPIVRWGDIVSGWEYLAFDSLSSGGAKLKVMALYDLPEPT